MLPNHETVIDQVRQLAAPLTSAERLALIQAIAALGSSDPPLAPPTSADGLSAEQEAWFARTTAERRQYAGQYVAVKGGRIVDHDPEQRALYLRIRKQFGAEPVLIVNADWDAPPTLDLRSPHLER
jgi:hypothetical protein